MFMPYLWISPIHLAVFTYLVYVEVGWPAFLATTFIILLIPLQIILAKLFAKLRWLELLFRTHDPGHCGKGNHTPGTCRTPL